MDSRWNRNTVSRVSSVTAVVRLPISWINSMADWFQVPAVSTATGRRVLLLLLLLLVVVVVVLFLFLLFLFYTL